MRKKGIVILCLCVVSVMIVGVVFCIKLMPPFVDTYYSNQLIKAIDDEDVLEVGKILKKRPSCVNAPETRIPRALHLLLTERDIKYPIIRASAVSNVEILNMLIEAGADVNLYDGSFTPLSVVYIVKGGDWYRASQLLIENGASLDYYNCYTGRYYSAILQDIVERRSALAAEPESTEEVVDAFNYALENCDHSKVNWMRVLQHSVTNDRIEIVKLLLEQGYCDVNDTSIGMTSLMFAARDSTPEMVQLLLEYGADKSIKSFDGKTAYDYAVEFNREDVIPILENGHRGRFCVLAKSPDGP